MSSSLPRNNKTSGFAIGFINSYLYYLYVIVENISHQHIVNNDDMKANRYKQVNSDMGFITQTRFKLVS